MFNSEKLTPSKNISYKIIFFIIFYLGICLREHVINHIFGVIVLLGNNEVF